MAPPLPTCKALAVLAVVVIAWGCNWSFTKLLVASVPPLWTTALRCWIAFAAVLAALSASGRLVRPPRGDLPAIAGTGLLHMVAFSALTGAGLAVLPASQAIVLGYTTPFWVALMAPPILGERLGPSGLAGVGLGLVGLAVLLNPAAFDWGRADTVTGCALVLAASLAWAANIVLIRSRPWSAGPLQLLVWQALVAALVLTGLALWRDGPPRFAWTGETVMLLLLSSLVGTVLGYWAMGIVNRSLPAVTTALGLTATPLVGIACAALLLGERIDPALAAAAGLIVAGLVVSGLSRAR
ncbi:MULTISPECIES: DMT family transporter [Methylobacterium]|uniref:DMT family transporter n=1 Tax=Methylobacterium TaxID=407 RepID=UPI0013EC735B|nr:DMT family transporter [Methylobacterium sp. DB0501]NGM34432.1 DMT family transporter [Methylobacterium sp. DB0501]